MDPVLPAREECVYTSCYCEENVWKLCEFVKQNNTNELSNSFAVFISNKGKAIPIWKQKACQSPGSPVIWDYHVIFVHKHTVKKTTVYDLDTELPFPCTFHTYRDEALQSEENMKKDFWRYFRVIPAESFLNKFASNREHMLDKNRGVYLAEPPNYPPIKTEESENNIESFISMETDVGFGKVMNLKEFNDFFCS